MKQHTYKITFPNGEYMVVKPEDRDQLTPFHLKVVEYFDKALRTDVLKPLSMDLVDHSHIEALDVENKAA